MKSINISSNIINFQLESLIINQIKRLFNMHNYWSNTHNIIFITYKMVIETISIMENTLSSMYFSATAVLMIASTIQIALTAIDGKIKTSHLMVIYT